MTTIQEVTVPDIGQYQGVEVIEVAVKPGASIKAEETLITLETEKASMDVPSPVSGVLKEMKLKVGDKVSKGDLIALIEINEKQITEPSPAKSEIKGSESEPEPTQITITVPDTGASVSHIEVIEVAVKPGDEVPLEGTLITLESEKASMDIPSSHQGTVESVLVKVGDKVKAGDPIVLMRVKEKPTAAAPKPTPTPTPVAPIAPPPKPATALPSVEMRSETTSFDPSLVHAGPATRRLARELGVDLSKVTGSGRKTRIITKDVHHYVKSILQGMQSSPSGFAVEKAPEIDFSLFGQIEVKPLSRIKKWTGKNLTRNWVTIPHITQFDEADITELEIFRQENKQAAEENGIKLTLLPFIIKAVVSVLKTFPQFNTSLAANGSDLIFKHYFNIGIAMDTPNGLVVPVIKNVDTKGLFDLAREVGELSNLARAGKLKTEQMQGSCFTISSLGSVGGTAFTPIINAPDVAILGISKVQIKPVFIDNQFVPRKILPLSLSYDHRVIDGVEGAKFTAFTAAQLQDIRKLLF